MKREILIVVLSLCLYLTGCSKESSGISGTVVDAETGKPIEGAVVLVEWTRQCGIGDKHTESIKVVENITDKSGKFRISGTLSPLVHSRNLTIYKKGYVAWSSRIIFPDYRNRTDFRWDDYYTFRLEHFKSEYSYVDHTAFISSAINSTIGNKKIITEAYYWEEMEASKERDKIRNTQISR